MHPLQKQFGLVLRRLREKAGVSQETLADLAGLHRNYVGLLERGQRMPSILVVWQLAAALGTTASQMFAKVEKDSS